MRAVINDSADIFTLINTFTVVPQKQGDVVKSLSDFTEQHARSLTGFIGASVHASLDGCRVVNYVQWDCEADLDAMMASPPAQAHIKEVGALAPSMWIRLSIGLPLSVRVSVGRNKRSGLVVGLGLQFLAAAVMHQQARAQAGSPFRYDDDVSQYAAQGARVSLYDELKYVPLGDDTGEYLSFGGDLRERVEVSSNALLGYRDKGLNAYDLHRLQVFANLHYDGFQVFVQLGN